MNRTIYKRNAILGIIGLIAAVLLLALWPFRLLSEPKTFSIAGNEQDFTGMIDEQHTVTQTFRAVDDHLDQIRIFLGKESKGDHFYLLLNDKNGLNVCKQEVKIPENALPGYVDAEIDLAVTVDDLYTMILQGDDSQITVGYEGLSGVVAWIGILSYDGTGIEGRTLTADYVYRVPLNHTDTLLYAVVIVLVTLILCLLVKGIYKNREDLVTIEHVVKVVLNPLVALIALGSLLAVLLGKVSNYVLDNTVYAVSIVFLSLILFYGINHNREGQAPVLTSEYLRTHVAELLQSVCFAFAMAACCEYMAGLYDIHHAIAERKEMIWFALAVICMFQWKEIINWWNLVYVVIAGVIGYRYYLTNLQADMDDMHMQVLRYTVYVAILLGLILIRTVLALCKKKMKRPAILYSGLILVFFAMIIIFRNTRWWTVTMAVAFTLLYLTYGMWEKKGSFLTNAARGVIMQFIAATGYCLLHRPYATYRTARYTHIFHTVTITATYLTMVECAALVLVIGKLSKSRRLRDVWKELTLLGVVSSYMIFTFARTAYAAIAVTIVFTLIFTVIGTGKGAVKRLLQTTGYLLLSLVLLLPVTFTLQRNLPALVSDPILYEIEYSQNYQDDILRGRNLKSINYMRVGRFIDIFCEKILGIPEGTFDIYGEQELVRRLRAEGYVVSADYTPTAEDIAELAGASDAQKDDYTNGRIDIFRSYIEQLNLTGHETMGATLENGEIATHAHDIYLQVAYDHGILTAVAFVFFGLATFFKACLYYFRRKEEDPFAALPVVITVAVAVAGVVEWIYHVSNPCGFLLMVVITPLVFDRKEKNCKKEA